MQKQYSISRAKDNLPEIIHAVEEGEAVQLTRHGTPVAVLLSIHQYQCLLSPRANFWDSMTSFRNFIKETDFLTVEESLEWLRSRDKGRNFSF